MDIAIENIIKKSMTIFNKRCMRILPCCGFVICVKEINAIVVVVRKFNGDILAICDFVKGVKVYNGIEVVDRNFNKDICFTMKSLAYCESLTRRQGNNVI